jgi:hypothetical protein
MLCEYFGRLFYNLNKVIIVVECRQVFNFLTYGNIFLFVLSFQKFGREK